MVLNYLCGFFFFFFCINGSKNRPEAFSEGNLAPNLRFFHQDTHWKERPGPGSLLAVIECLMEKNWPSRVALFCKCVFLSSAKIFVFIHFHLQSIEPAWAEYKCTLISERALRSYQERKTRGFLWELDSISRNQWVLCHSENAGVGDCGSDLPLQNLHGLCLSHTTQEPPLFMFVTDKSAQMGAVCWPQFQAKVIEQTEGLHIRARVQTA